MDSSSKLQQSEKIASSLYSHGCALETSPLEKLHLDVGVPDALGQPTKDGLHDIEEVREEEIDAESTGAAA